MVTPRLSSPFPSSLHPRPKISPDPIKVIPQPCITHGLCQNHPTILLAALSLFSSLTRGGPSFLWSGLAPYTRCSASLAFGFAFFLSHGLHLFAVSCSERCRPQAPGGGQPPQRPREEEACQPKSPNGEEARGLCALNGDACTPKCCQCPPSSTSLLSAVRSKQTPKVQKMGPVCHPPWTPVLCQMHGPTASLKDYALDRGFSFFLQKGREERVMALGRV